MWSQQQHCKPKGSLKSTTVASVTALDIGSESLGTAVVQAGKAAQNLYDSLASDSLPSLASISIGSLKSDRSEAAQGRVEPPSGVQVDVETNSKKKQSKGLRAFLVNWKASQLNKSSPTAQEAAQQQDTSSPVVDATSEEHVATAMAMPQDGHVPAAVAAAQQRTAKVSFVQRMEKAGSKVLLKVATKLNKAVILCDAKLANFKPAFGKLHVRQLQAEVAAQQQHIQQLQQHQSSLLAAVAQKDAALTDKDATLANKDAALAEMAADLAKKNAIIQQQQQWLSEFAAVREAVSRVSAQQRALAARMSTGGALHRITQAAKPLLDSALGVFQMFKAPQKGTPEAQLRILQKQVSQQAATITDKTYSIRVLTRQVKARDETIDSMEVAFQQLRQELDATRQKLAASQASCKQLERRWNNAMEQLSSYTSF